MNPFDAAVSLYHDGKLLLDSTRDLAAEHHELRWAREDAEEDLLDLKLAVIDLNVADVPELIDDVQRMILIIRQLVDQ